MNFFRGIVADLRERKLLPVAVVLAVALVALPVLLHKSASAGSRPASPSPQRPAKRRAPQPGRRWSRWQRCAPTPTSTPSTPRIRSARFGRSRSSRPPTSCVEFRLPGGSITDGGSGGAKRGGDSNGGFSWPTGPLRPPGRPTTLPRTGTPAGTTTTTTDRHEDRLHARGRPQLRRPPATSAGSTASRGSRCFPRRGSLLVFLGVDPSATQAVFLVDARLKRSG